MLGADFSFIFWFSFNFFPPFKKRKEKIIRLFLSVFGSILKQHICKRTFPSLIFNSEFKSFSDLIYHEHFEIYSSLE